MRRTILALTLALAAASHQAAFAAQTTTAPAGDVAARARAFVDLLAKGDFAGATKNMDETMSKLFPPEKLRELWEALNAQVGPMKRFVGARADKAGGYDVGLVTAEFEKTGIEFKVVFDAEGRVTGFFVAPVLASAESYKSPAYVKTALFESREVTVGAGEWALPGTLTLPTGKGPFPAVVLVHGSGPNDRDETVGPNKPFRDIAEGLASQGVAALRYEKRTRQHGARLASVMESFTVGEETIDDALAAVALLRKTERVDPRRVFVVGHSLGATLAPRIARADPSVAGLIIMAGASSPIEDIIVPQFTYVFSLDGTVSPEEQAQLDKFKQQVARLKDPKTSDATPAADMPFGLPAHYWLSIRGYRAADDARTLKQPMLVLHGARDYQVTTQEFEGWKVLAARKDVELKSYPKLNHLFVEGEGRSTPSEYSKAGNVPLYVIEDIAAFIRKH